MSNNQGEIRSDDREELRAGVYYLSAIAAKLQTTYNYAGESETNPCDIPLKTKTGRLLNHLSTSLTRGPGGAGVARVIAVTSTPFFNQDGNLVVSVFSSPNTNPTVSPSNSSSAVKVEKSDVEEASSAELDDITPRNSGSKKTGEREQWEIPDPIPGQPLNFRIPKQFPEFALHSLRLLRAAARQMKSETGEEAAQTRFKICAYFTEACQKKLAQRMELLTNTYPIQELQNWDYDGGVNLFEETSVSIVNAVVERVFRGVGLVGRNDVYPFNQSTVGLLWKALVFLLRQLDNAQKLAKSKQAAHVSCALHDVLASIPAEFWDSAPLAMFLRRCHINRSPPILSLVEATSQEAEQPDGHAEEDQPRNSTERKGKHGNEMEHEQKADTDGDQPDGREKKLGGERDEEQDGDADGEEHGDMDGEEHEDIGTVLPTANPLTSRALPECTLFTRMVDAVCAWTTGPSHLLDTPIARSTAPIRLNVVDLPRVAVPQKAIPDLVTLWTTAGSWSVRVAQMIKEEFTKLGNDTSPGTTHCEAGLVAMYLNDLSNADDDHGCEKGAHYLKPLAGPEPLSIGVAKKCCPICHILIQAVGYIYRTEIEAPGRHGRFHTWVPPASLPTQVLKELERRLVRLIGEMVSEGAHLAASRASSPTSDTSQGNRKKFKVDISEYESQAVDLVPVRRSEPPQSVSSRMTYFALNTYLFRFHLAPSSNTLS